MKGHCRSPWTIKLVPNWRSLGLIIGGLGLLIWLIFVAGLFFVGGLGALDGSTLLFLAVCIFGFLGLITLLDSPWIRLTMTLSEEGMLVRGFGTKRSILWKQVRLFAIASEGKVGTPVSEYELADLTTSLRVRRLRREARLQVLKPQTTFEVYEQQMEAMLSFIAAKTGVPLYDLRS